MSDSSSEEDLSHFASAVDPSFLHRYKNNASGATGCHSNGRPAAEKPASQRYLTAESHYNDVRASDEMQRKIGSQLSKLIEKKVEFVEEEPVKLKKRKIKGGIKLFSTSSSYLSAEMEKDEATELHNQRSRKVKRAKRRVSGECGDVGDREKLEMAVVTPEHILSGEETKHWKSRRREKMFKYKSQGKGKVLVAVAD